MSALLNDNKDPYYITADGWARLIALLWLKPHLAAAWEKNPIKEMVDRKDELKGVLSVEKEVYGKPCESQSNNQYQFDIDNPDGRRDRLIKIPPNPGYSVNDLNDACIGKVTIVPMTSWTICGVSKK